MILHSITGCIFNFAFRPEKKRMTHAAADVVTAGHQHQGKGQFLIVWGALIVLTLAEIYLGYNQVFTPGPDGRATPAGPMTPANALVQGQAQRGKVLSLSGRRPRRSRGQRQDC